MAGGKKQTDKSWISLAEAEKLISDKLCREPAQGSDPVSDEPDPDPNTKKTGSEIEQKNPDPT